MTKKTFLVPFFVLGLTISLSQSALATHAWGNYHWARSTNPLSLKLGDNMSSSWKSYLVNVSSDWNLSTVLHTNIVPGNTNPKNCKATSGRVEVCSNRYGNTGWLGIASIWASGNHITQGTVKVNDTYFSTSKYNTAAWKNLVLCQEIGHTFGLDHQDEDFSNSPLGTCMDYTNDPTPNQHPNLHDYEMLETIYAHLDAQSTTPTLPRSKRQEVDHLDPSSWGKAIKTSKNGHNVLYEKSVGNGEKIFTFVIWAE